MIRVVVQDQFAFGDNISISFGMSLGSEGVTKIARIDDHGTIRWEDFEPGSSPTLRIDSDVARALLEELTRFFHGAGDTRALRRDYDSERQRVDVLTRALMDSHVTALQIVSDDLKVQD